MPGPVPLADSVAVVTGASRGFGRAIAGALASAGARIALVARESDELRATEAELPDSHAIPADLAHPEGADRAAHACLNHFGRIDVLVNNAAIQGAIGPFVSEGGTDWEAVFRVNLFAPVRLARLALPGMVARGFGRIINISGGGATGPRPDFSAYGASKCALVRFTETLAQELSGTGVTANAVAPGAMNTRMLAEVLAAGPNRARHEFAAAEKRAGTGGASPETAAELVVWLASAASDGISGRLLSAVWDDWSNLPERAEQLAASDIYTLRRITPDDRGGWKKCA